MPADRGPRVDSARFEPYPSLAAHASALPNASSLLPLSVTLPNGTIESGGSTNVYRELSNKENEVPSTAAATSKPRKDSASSVTSSSKPKGSSTSKGPSKASPDCSNLPDHYLDIVLEDVFSEEGTSEIPCYEDAAAVRRKLKALIDKKVKIPGSDKTFNQTTLSKELREVAARENPVECANYQMSRGGPSPISLSRFLKKTGSMGGGNSESYYFGTILLEKLRIWNGEKKTAARIKAEEKFPRGRIRVDPATVRMYCVAGDVPSRSEVANWGR